MKKFDDHYENINPPLFKNPYKRRVVHNAYDFFLCILLVGVMIACVVYGLGYMAFEKFAPQRLQNFVFKD